MRIITGKARGLQLTVPKTYDVRPTADRVKESVFNIIGSKIIGAEVLDLFAGTGNLGLESWSRGAVAVTFIDASKESLRLVRSNIAAHQSQRLLARVNKCNSYSTTAPAFQPQVTCTRKKVQHLSADNLTAYNIKNGFLNPVRSRPYIVGFRYSQLQAAGLAGNYSHILLLCVIIGLR